MKRTIWLHLIMVFVVAGFAAASAEEGKTDAKSTTTTTTSSTASASTSADSTTTKIDADDDWLNTVWTQVDHVVKKEELKLQETVTVAGVRGAEAEDNLLDKLYYKGGKRYPSQDKLKKAIDTLKESIAADPKGKDAAKLKFFVAQCYEKIGNGPEAKNYYGQVVKDHPDSKFATQAKTALAAMGPAK